MFCGTAFNWCQVHHFWHWLDLGPSQLWNLGPLCNTHHHQIHHNGHQIIRNPDHTLNLQTASGYIIASTTVPHPQPPDKLGISHNYQLPHGHNPDRSDEAGRNTNPPNEPGGSDLTDSGQKSHLTNTGPWPDQPLAGQTARPTINPNPSLF
ncbi:MAG: hypothetical protein V3V01_13295, partial [Acidimicrobiales bacterium]